MIRRFAFLMLAVSLALGSVARADDADAIRTMLGLAAFPNNQDYTEYVGTLPKDMLLIPQPNGLSILGSVTASNNGKVASEIVYYQSQPGSVPDINGYMQQLSSQGWNVWAPTAMPNIPFMLAAMASAPRTFCKTGSPTITVRSQRQYLIVQANAAAGICTSALAQRLAQTRPTISKAPYPTFVPPDGAIFVGSAKQTFSGNAHVASIGLVSTATPTVLLASLAKQMLSAGWKAKTTAAVDGDSQAFSIRDSDGVDWIAALSVVPVGSGMDLFTASAFKISETMNQSVSAR